jgi:hypothetical protein
VTFRTGEASTLSSVLYMGDTASTDPAAPEYDLIAVAGYVAPSSFLSYRALVARFYPEKHIFSITPSADGTAECLDVEKGDAVPAQAGPWLRRMLALKIYRPCVYAQASNMPAVIESLRGIPRSDYRLWVAAWSNDHAVPPGYDAHQFYGTMTGSWDYSVVAADFFPEAHHPILHTLHPPDPEPKIPGSFRAHKQKTEPKPPPVKRLPTHIHPKVAAGGLASAVATAILAVLHAHGAFLTPAESSAIAGGAALIAGYVTKSG